MSIIRIKKHRSGYVIIDRRALDDTRLSWCARGLLAYLLARPDSWTIRKEHLVRQSPGTEYQVTKLLKELKQAVYAALQEVRADDGTLAGKEWVIFEVPELGNKANRHSENADVGESPRSVNPRHRETVDVGKASTPGLSKPLSNIENGSANTEKASATTRPRGQDAMKLVDLLRPHLQPEPTPDDATDADSDLEVLVSMLTARGIDVSMARRLVESYDAERIRRQVTNYDRQQPDSPGWLVRAIEQDYALRPEPASEILTHGEMLNWCESNGGLHRTEEFEVVRLEGGVIRFRRPL